MLERAGEPVVLTVYPDAYHGFDEPGTGPHKRYDIPGLIVTVGSNPEAREDAYAKVKEYLKEAIGNPSKPND
jgi:dienelactone hydrolase